MSDRERGLYEKYRVIRLGDETTQAKHAGCEYFVLDLVHDRHALVALAAYAEACRYEYPVLAEDLRDALGFHRDNQAHSDYGEPA